MISAATRSLLEGATEIRHRKGGDLPVEVQLDGSFVESRNCRTQLREQPVLRVNLVAVRVEAAQGTEKDLSGQANGAANLKQLGNLLQLHADGVVGSGEDSLKGRRAGKSLRDDAAVLEGIVGDGACGLNKREAGV